MTKLIEKMRNGVTFYRGIHRFSIVIRQRDEDRFNFLDEFYHNEIPKVMESTIQTIMDSLSPIFTKLIEIQRNSSITPDEISADNQKQTYILVDPIIYF